MRYVLRHIIPVDATRLWNSYVICYKFRSVKITTDCISKDDICRIPQFSYARICIIVSNLSRLHTYARFQYTHLGNSAKEFLLSCACSCIVLLLFSK